MCSTTWSFSRSCSRRAPRCCSSFVVRSTAPMNSAIKRAVSTASSSNACGSRPRIERTPITAPSRWSGAQISDRIPRRPHTSPSVRGSIDVSAEYTASPFSAASAREACRAVESKPDVPGRDPGGVVVDRLVPFEPLHRRAVGAAEALCAQDDRARQRFVVELERGDLLLRLDDRMQPAEARPQTLLVAPPLRDVAQRGVHPAAVQDAARVLDHDLGAVLAKERPLGPELARSHELLGLERRRRELYRREQLLRPQATQLGDRAQEEGRRSIVRVDDHVVRVEHEDRVGRAVVQLAVAAFARAELRDQLGVSKRDRRACREHADLFDARFVECSERRAADAEHAADLSVPLERCERDRRRTRCQASVDLGAGRLAQHGQLPVDAGRTERLFQTERPSLERQVLACADAEVGESVVDGRDRGSVGVGEQHQLLDDAAHDGVHFAGECSDLEIRAERRHEMSPSRSAVATACVRVDAPRRLLALRTCVRTVSEPMPSRCAISSCASPSASRPSTSRSRVVSVSVVFTARAPGDGGHLAPARAHRSRSGAARRRRPWGPTACLGASAARR